MTISIKEGAASGTAVSPDPRHISSLKAASSPPPALTVSSSHYADRWTLRDPLAAYEPEKDHWSGSLPRPMRSLSEPIEKPSPSHVFVDPHYAGYWTVDNAFAAHGSEEDHRSKLLRLMRSLSEPDANSMAKVGIVSGSGTLVPISGLTDNRSSEFYALDEAGYEAHDDPSSLRGTVSQNTRWLWFVPVSSDHLSRMIESTKLTGHWYPDLLRDALHDLNQAKEEAREDGFPAPSEKTLRNARRLLHAMYRISPRRFEVYPTPDGEIAIDAPGGPGRSVLLLFDSDDGALCLVNMNGAHRRARYSDTRGLPDGFVREALAELEQQRNTLAA